MQECEVWGERMSAALDGEATAEEEAALQSHLAECRDCARLYEELKKLHELLPSLAETPPAQLREKTLASIGGEKVLPLRKRAAERKRAWGGWAAAAAAVVCIASLGLVVYRSGWEDPTAGSAGGDATALLEAPIAGQSGERQTEGEKAMLQAAGGIAPAAAAPADGIEAPQSEGGETGLSEASSETVILYENSAPDGEPIPAPSACADESADRMDPTGPIASFRGEEKEYASSVPVVTEEEALEILAETLGLGKSGTGKTDKGGEEQSITSLGLSEDGGYYLFLHAVVTNGACREETYAVSVSGREVLSWAEQP